MSEPELNVPADFNDRVKIFENELSDSVSKIVRKFILNNPDIVNAGP